jgi:hypothetical protein
MLRSRETGEDGNDGSLGEHVDEVVNYSINRL